MQIDKSAVRDALTRVLLVEREHLFGARTGSPTARRRELEKELDREFKKMMDAITASGSNK